MDKRDLTDLLRVLKENRNKEFKRSTPWLEKEFKCKIAKSILAFSNVRDGGFIVIGVNQLEDKSFDPVGMSDEDFKTYNEDHVQAFVAEYADPFSQVEFHPLTLENKKFVVIKVFEFAEIPVICKKDGSSNLRKGAIYTRTYRIPESAEVPSQSEMREILDLAAEKQVRRFFETQSRAGITVEMIKIDNTKFAQQSQVFDA
jgi:predicted HTH transcriptional regulator